MPSWLWNTSIKNGLFLKMLTTPQDGHDIDKEMWQPIIRKIKTFWVTTTHKTTISCAFSTKTSYSNEHHSQIKYSPSWRFYHMQFVSCFFRIVIERPCFSEFIKHRKRTLRLSKIRANNIWRPSNSERNRISDEKVTSILRLKFFLEVHGSPTRATEGNREIIRKYEQCWKFLSNDLSKKCKL